MVSPLLFSYPMVGLPSSSPYLAIVPRASRSIHAVLILQQILDSWPIRTADGTGVYGDAFDDTVGVVPDDIQPESSTP